MSSLSEDHHTPVRTFLIADIRGYTRFTEEYGDEASARLTAKFSDIVREGVQVRGGTLIEIRGDEALAVFDSARQAIRSAVDLQSQFAEETDPDSDLPLRVGIGIDSGEAIKLENGYLPRRRPQYRCSALRARARRGDPRQRRDQPPGWASARPPVHRPWTSAPQGDRRHRAPHPRGAGGGARPRSGSSWSSGGREALAGLFFS